MILTGDTTIYAKGEVVRDVFSQFPGSRTPISTDGAAWKSARKMMQYALFNLHS